MATRPPLSSFDKRPPLSNFEKGAGQEPGENRLQNFLRSETIPNIGQGIAGFASLALPGAGKAKRAAVGTVGRAGGEALRGSAEDLAAQFGLVEDSTPTSKDNLERFAKETAVGASSEALGEFVIGPILSKTWESVISPTLGAGRKLAGKAVKSTDDFISKIPIVGKTKDVAKAFVKNTLDTVDVFNREKLAGNLLEEAGIPKSKRTELQKRAVNRYFNLVEEGTDAELKTFESKVADLISDSKIGGNTIGDYQISTTAFLRETGEQIANDLSDSSVKVSLDAVDDVMTEDINLIRNAGGEQAKKLANQMEVEWNSIKKAKPDEMSALEAWETVKSWEELGNLYKTSGAKSAGADTQATKRVYSNATDVIRANLREEVPELMDDYSTAKIIQEGVFGGPLQQTSKQLSASPGRSGAVGKLLFGGFRDPEFITSQLQKQSSGGWPVGAPGLDAILRTSQQMGEAGMGAWGASKLDAIKRARDSTRKK